MSRRIESDDLVPVLYEVTVVWVDSLRRTSIYVVDVGDKLHDISELFKWAEEQSWTFFRANGTAPTGPGPHDFRVVGVVEHGLIKQYASNPEPSD